MSSSTGSNPTNTSSQRRHRHRRHRNVKGALLVLHGLSATFSFTSICIFASVIPIWNANFFHSSSLVKGDWPDGLTILPLLISLITSLHYLGKRLKARTCASSSDYLSSRHKGSSTSPISAKITVYLTLTILILLMTLLILAGVSGLFRFWRPAVSTSSIQTSSEAPGSGSSLSTLATISLSLRRSISDSNPLTLTPPTGGPVPLATSQNSKKGFHSCTLANVFTRRCNPTLYLIGDLQIAAVTTGSIVWLLNLALLILQAREYQYAKRKHQRSLRAKAKAKFETIEDELSKAEKGDGPKQMIHHEKRRGLSDPATDPASRDKSTAPMPIKPQRTHTNPTPKGVQPTVRPKQHYYDPGIASSRPRGGQDAQHEYATSKNLASGSPQTSYSRAVEEARRKVKPAETMRDWLAGRYS